MLALVECATVVLDLIWQMVSFTKQFTVARNLESEKLSLKASPATQTPASLPDSLQDVLICEKSRQNTIDHRLYFKNGRGFPVMLLCIFE